jgi:hypothetical protein
MTRAVVIVFLALVGFVLIGDAVGWFSTPLNIAGGRERVDPERVESDLLRSARATCRFGAAITKAGVRGRTKIDAAALADAYVDGLANLSAEQERAVRNACLQGLRRGLRAERQGD